MIKEPTYKVLLWHFDKSASLKWLVTGIAIGITVCIWGGSPIPAFALKLASGFGWVLIALILVAIVLSLMSFYLKGQSGHLAHGD